MHTRNKNNTNITSSLTINGGEISVYLNSLTWVSNIKLIKALSRRAYLFLKTTNLDPDNFIEVSEQELKKISSLKTPNKVIALFKIPVEKNSSPSGLIVALDAINDPGNLGTIIRLCDWFGIDQLLCSKETVDCYNTKVVQSSMGSLTRVAISYIDLKEYLTSVSIPVFIEDMDGDNIYEMMPPTSAVLVMGNEANGISNSIKQIVSTKITIPRYGNSQLTESLNVATATAILLSEFRR